MFISLIFDSGCVQYIWFIYASFDFSFPRRCTRRCARLPSTNSCYELGFEPRRNLAMPRSLHLRIRLRMTCRCSLLPSAVWSTPTHHQVPSPTRACIHHMWELGKRIRELLRQPTLSLRRGSRRVLFVQYASQVLKIRQRQFELKRHPCAEVTHAYIHKHGPPCGTCHHASHAMCGGRGMTSTLFVGCMHA